ncbi:MAG: NADAR family protein [Pseudomonadota bacterium]
MICFPEQPDIFEEDLPRSQDFDAFHPFIKGVFSQWHATPFTADGAEFVCAEQYMMAAKANLFGDDETAKAIMESADPAVQKRLGSEILTFDQSRWGQWRFHIVYHANLGKFSQNPGALRQLRNTAPAMLVEANPRDWNWGNGLQIDDPANHDSALWKGTNFLGRILTMIRIKLV